MFILFASCKKDYQSGEVKLRFTHKVGTRDLVYRSVDLYTNVAGNQYNVTNLQYYISNVVFTSKGGQTYPQNTYDLISATDTSTTTLSFPNMQGNEYDKVSFYVGIDSVKNHSGDQSGDLAPIHNMIWTWASGYVFLKVEGKYIDSTGTSQNYRLHLGTEPNLVKVELPASFVLDGATRTIDLNMDLNELFKNPNTIDISQNPDIQSFPSESDITGKYAQNQVDMFTIINIK
ncbi:MAG: hypothetical protein KA010_00875 [Saprospiraceae bacterium]|nr:hypothetical protein [Saprospiraceae bacterium]